MSKVRVSSTGGDDQVVVEKFIRVELNLATLKVDARCLSQQHGNILVFPENMADRIGNFTGRKCGGSNLIEKRLKCVVIAAINESNTNVCFGKRARSIKPAEARTDDHDMRNGFCNLHVQCVPPRLDSQE